MTGAGSATLEHVEEAVARLKRHTELPVCVGFGIRTPEQAAAIARLTEGVVVGSALIDQIANAKSNAQAVEGVLELPPDQYRRARAAPDRTVALQSTAARPIRAAVLPVFLGKVDSAAVHSALPF